jgi:hypothetical protein
LSSRQEHGLAAANAARSTVSNAISQILRSPEFGRQRLAGEEIRLESTEATGFLTFSSSAAEENGLPYSTNNLEGTEDTDGAGGTTVPSATVHLLAVGRSGGVERRVEAVLRLPPFPWAIASGGRIETRNGVLVAALPEGVWPPPTDESKLLPADLIANGRDPQAIVLANNSTVLGDVETPGRVVLGEIDVNVRGEILSGSKPVELPTLHPADYDPEANDTAHFDLADGNVTELAGSARAADDITFPETLTLSSAHLFVDGDLNLPKGVQGTGVLVATGDISMGSGVNLEGLTELAVVSGGRVRLSGQGTGRSVMRGLFYAERGLDAAELTLVGSLLTGQASTGVTLDRVNVYYEPPAEIAGVAGELPNGGVELMGRVLSVQRPVVRQRLSPEIAFETRAEDPQRNQPRPNGYGRLFFVDFQPTDGGYPLRVEVWPGLIPLYVAPQVLESQGDLWNWMVELRKSLEDPELVTSFTGGYHATADDPVFNELIQGLESKLSNIMIGGGAPGQPSVAIFGDISRFLPIEDRVRVVSWIER